LEQDNHELRQQLESFRKNSTLNLGLEEENQTLKEVLDVLRTTKEDEGRAHRGEMRKLADDLEKTSSQLSKKELQVTQLEEKVQRLESELEEVQEAANKKFLSAETDEEIAALREEATLMDAEARDAKMERDELSDRLARLDLDNQVMEEQLETRSREIEQLDERYNDAYTSLREAKTTIATLQDELAAANTLAASGGRQFGTDMFSEIEEKRERLEKERFVLNRKIERMRRELDLADHQKTQLRNQVSMLMHTRGNKADAAARQKLEQSLSQKHSEYMQLGVLNKKLEKRIADGEKMVREHLRGAANAGKDTNQVYLDFLDTELEQHKTEIRRLKDDLRTMVLQKMNETEKLRKTERGVHDSSLRNEQLMMTNMELKMKVDELAMQNASLQPVVYVAPPRAGSPLADAPAATAAPSLVATASASPTAEEGSAQALTDGAEAGSEVDAPTEVYDDEEVEDTEEDGARESPESADDASPLRAAEPAKVMTKITIADDKANECPTQ
jgi:chromosome segregation ATPase